MKLKEFIGNFCLYGLVVIFCAMIATAIIISIVCTGWLGIWIWVGVGIFLALMCGAFWGYDY